MKLMISFFVIVFIILSSLIITGCAEDEPEEVVDLGDGEATENEEPIDEEEPDPESEIETEPAYTEVEILADFALWETASDIWEHRYERDIINKTDDNISFNLPVSDNHYYIFTFGGWQWELAPSEWDKTFGELSDYDGLKIEFDYMLQSDLSSLILYIQQYDKSERIVSESWNLPAKQGNNAFDKFIILKPDAETYRLYLRIVNPEVDNNILLNSLRLIGYKEQ